MIQAASITRFDAIIDTAINLSPAKGIRGKRGFVITNELKRVESRFAYRGHGIVFTFRFNNERHGVGREKFPARNGKQIAEPGSIAFTVCRCDFRQCRHSTGISTTATLVPRFTRRRRHRFQHDNRFPPNVHSPVTARQMNTAPLDPLNRLYLQNCVAQKHSFNQNRRFYPPSLSLSTRRKMNSYEIFVLVRFLDEERGFTAPLINRDDKRIRFSGFATTVLRPRSTATSHRGREDKDAISAASIVSRGVKKTFKCCRFVPRGHMRRQTAASRRLKLAINDIPVRFMRHDREKCRVELFLLVKIKFCLKRNDWKGFGRV